MDLEIGQSKNAKFWVRSLQRTWSDIFMRSNRRIRIFLYLVKTIYNSNHTVVILNAPWWALKVAVDVIHAEVAMIPVSVVPFIE